MRAKETGGCSRTGGGARSDQGSNVDGARGEEKMWS